MLIGNKMKELREAQRLSLTELSQKSGVQLATLSRIENLKMTGTIDSHMRIAKALQIQLTELYTDIIKEDSRIDHQTPKSLSDIYVHSEKSANEMLTSNVLKKKMMPVLTKIEPEGQTNPEQNKPGSEMFVYVLEGKVEAKIEGETFVLGKSNTLYFDAALKHYFVNTGKSAARVLCVTTPVAL